MAMLITKFHRLIQSKLLWLSFLVIVVFSFVIWGTESAPTNDQGATDAGTLDGESIGFEEYQRARFNTYLAIVLMTGRAVNITPEIEDQLHTMAWQRLATLRQAERHGVKATNDEVVKAIQALEFLQSNGQFNTQAYDQFSQQFLAPMRATKRDFEEHVRQEIVMQKLRAIMDRTLLVTPMEIERTYSSLTDTFEIEYVEITPALVSETVSVSEDDVRAFYDKDPEQFRLATQVKVKAAVFPVADHIDTNAISEAEVQEYYDFNLDDYAIEDENKEADTNLFSTATTSYRPIEDVRGEIVALLAAKQAVLDAEAKASAFIGELTARHSDGRAAFTAVAAEQGIELLMLQPFSARQVPPEVESGTAVARASFNLSDDNDYYYSDPVRGTNFVYVLALEEKIPERVPEFEEVRDDVELMAKDMAVYQALTEKAQEIHESAIAGLSAGLTFDDALAAYKLTGIKPAPFNMNTIELPEEVASALVRHILVRNAGEVTDLVNTEDGRILLAYVKSRTPAIDASLDAMRPQIVNTLRRQVSQVAFNDMQNYLLKKGGHQDNLRRTRTAVDDESESGAEPEDAEPEEAETTTES